MVALLVASLKPLSAPRPGLREGTGISRDRHQNRLFWDGLANNDRLFDHDRILHWLLLNIGHHAGRRRLDCRAGDCTGNAADCSAYRTADDRAGDRTARRPGSRAVIGESSAAEQY